MSSTFNKNLLETQKQAVEEADEDNHDGHKHGKEKRSCCCFRPSGDHFEVDGDSEYEEDTNFASKFIISRDDRAVKLLEFTVSALYLISGYFYGYLAAFRYSDFTDDANFYFFLTLVFESVFLVHMLLQFLTDYKVEGK